ncbi:MAG: hypothetical protein R3C03_22945 [Pirellulaceae bacterium]
MSEAFAASEMEFKRLGIAAGEMISVYTKFRMKEGVFEYISGFCISEGADLPRNSNLTTWSIPATQAFQVKHIGPYRHLETAGVLPTNSFDTKK